MSYRGTVISMLVVLLVVLVVVYLLYQSAYHSAPELAIAPAAVREKRFRTIIDVRSPKEREELGYYPNSVPIAVEKLHKEIPALIGDGLQSKQTPILVYSNGDARAQRAAETLFAMGYVHVQYLPTTYLSLMPGSHQ
jgi:rhodanese-related sulfurtransferase